MLRTGSLRAGSQPLVFAEEQQINIGVRIERASSKAAQRDQRDSRRLVAARAAAPKIGEATYRRPGFGPRVQARPDRWPQNPGGRVRILLCSKLRSAGSKVGVDMFNP